MIIDDIAEGANFYYNNTLYVRIPYITGYKIDPDYTEATLTIYTAFNVDDCVVEDLAIFTEVDVCD